MSAYPHDLERLRYWQGQTLRSVDWRDQLRFDARRRGLHNRSLHSVDGVSFGLTLTRQTADPTQYDVACGLAYDCTGRELILQRPRSVRAPTEPMWLILRLRPGPAGGGCCPAPDPGCTPQDATLLEQDVELVWHPIGSVERLNGVALARFTPAGPDAAFRPRVARPLARPRLAWGRTVRGNTPWEPWSIDEPDGQGGIRRKVVGVETRIDTSAAGFTLTPAYFVSIESPAWDVAKAEFAPAFFPHVANATVDGFTCRLLMLETARRRYSAAEDTARVRAISRAAGDRLLVELEVAPPFRAGDMIALVRPRARSVVRVTKASGKALTLSAELENVTPDETVLAVGNLPRAARVLAPPQTDPTVLVTFSGPPVKKGDVLLRTSDNARAVLGGTTKKKRIVAHPFHGWALADPIAIARVEASAEVKNATASADRTATEVEVAALPAAIVPDTMVALLDQQKVPLATAGKVTKRDGNTITVQPPLSAPDMAALKKVVLFVGITPATLEPRTAGAAVKVESTERFDVGDVVSAATDPSVLTTVDEINGAQELVLASAIPLPEDSLLVAANWRCATTVSSLGATGTNEVTVGRSNAVVPGSFVARREDPDFPSPVMVKSVSGAVVTLASSIPDLARLETLAVGVFPGIVTVTSQQTQPEQIQVLEPGLLNSGDEVVALGATGATAVARVASANGTNVVLVESLGLLTPGQQLAVVHFRDRSVVAAVDATDPLLIELERDVDARPDDVVGVLSHSADNSNPGRIQEVNGNTLTLALPGIVHGDGIVPTGWIDGGVVGPAAVSYLPPFGFPGFQPIVRLISSDGLAPVERAIAYGLDQLTGRFVSRGVLSLRYESTGRWVWLFPGNQAESYSFRPETLSLITTFNTDFPSAFATFAQKQKLAVSWIGCQQEFPPASGCPGQEPDDPCGAPNFPED